MAPNSKLIRNFILELLYLKIFWGACLLEFMNTLSPPPPPPTPPTFQTWLNSPVIAGRIWHVPEPAMSWTWSYTLGYSIFYPYRGMESNFLNSRLGFEFQGAMPKICQKKKTTFYDLWETCPDSLENILFIVAMLVPPRHSLIVICKAKSIFSDPG